MSKISFNVSDKGISILVEPEVTDSRSTEPFIDKFGNVWKVEEFVNFWYPGGFHADASNITKDNFRVVETELVEYE